MLSICVAIASLSPLAAPVQKLDYKILYAGVPGSAREKGFSEFFNASFTRSGVTDLAKFDGSQGQGYDIVFLDFRAGKFERPKLPTNYKTPTVVTGWTGVWLVDEGRYKGSNYW